MVWTVRRKSRLTTELPPKARGDSDRLQQAEPPSFLYELVSASVRGPQLWLHTPRGPYLRITKNYVVRSERNILYLYDMHM